jgi:hypothetical protein
MKTLISTVIAIVFSVSLMAQSSANLSLNLDMNKTYKIKSTTEQNTTVTFGGAPQQSVTSSYSFLSLKPVSNGKDFIVAELRFDTIATKVSMPKMDMNSTKPGNIKSTDPSEVVGCILNRLSSQTFNVKLALTGNVIEISNLKAIVDNILKDIDSIQGQAAPMLKAQIGMMISENALKGMIEAITAYLPGKKVSVGESWNSRITISAGGLGMLIDNNYKLKKINGTQAEVSAEATIEPASQAPMDMGGAQITYDVRGLGKTTLIIDTKTGWIVKATSKSHNQGNMNIKAQGNDMQMPMETDGTTEIVAVP